MGLFFGMADLDLIFMIIHVLIIKI